MPNPNLCMPVSARLQRVPKHPQSAARKHEAKPITATHVLLCGPHASCNAQTQRPRIGCCCYALEWHVYVYCVMCSALKQLAMPAAEPCPFLSIATKAVAPGSNRGADHLQLMKRSLHVTGSLKFTCPSRCSFIPRSACKSPACKHHLVHKD